MSQSLIHIKVHTHRSHIKAIASNLGLMHRIKNYVSGRRDDGRTRDMKTVRTELGGGDQEEDDDERRVFLYNLKRAKL